MADLGTAMTQEPDSDEMAGYRPVSPLAVATLVAGAASALVLVTPLAAMIPLVALALAVAALADLRRAEGKRAGRPLALIGLALAVGFAAQAFTAGVIDSWIARNRAAAAADAWIDAVREERLTDAMSICGPGAFSLPHAVTMAAEPPTPDVREAAFRAVPAVAAVMGCAAVRPVVTDISRPRDGGLAWMVTADLSGCGGTAESLRIIVEPRSETGPRGTLERWLVVSLGLEP